MMTRNRALVDNFMKFASHSLYLSTKTTLQLTTIAKRIHQSQPLGLGARVVLADRTDTI